MTLKDRWRRRLIIISHWEFWPWKVIYFPVFLYYLLLCIRARTYVFFTVPNKLYMKHGGILEESKLEMYRKTPEGLMPVTLPFQSGIHNDLAAWLEKNNLQFPLIVKPDRGMRGMGIQIINSIEELETIVLKPGFNYIIQEFLDYPKEAGIFCIKNPKTGRWKVTSIMEREFLTVSGNGISTLEELIRKDFRAFLQLSRWQKENKFNLDEVLPKKKVKVMEKLGNHRLGTCFVDKMSCNTPDLQKAMAALCEQLEGFEYGRLDIRFESWEKLEKLRAFKIIEVNGTNSEPAHIYDPKHSIFYAWKVLFYHWNWVFRISIYRMKEGVSPLPYSKYKILYKDYLRLMKY